MYEAPHPEKSVYHFVECLPFMYKILRTSGKNDTQQHSRNYQHLAFIEFFFYHTNNRQYTQGKIEDMKSLNHRPVLN